MSDAIGLALAIGFAWFAVNAFACGHYIATAIFCVALVAVLFAVCSPKHLDKTE